MSKTTKQWPLVCKGHCTPWTPWLRSHCYYPHWDQLSQAQWTLLSNGVSAVSAPGHSVTYFPVIPRWHEPKSEIHPLHQQVPKQPPKKCGHKVYLFAATSSQSSGTNTKSFKPWWLKKLTSCHTLLSTWRTCRTKLWKKPSSPMARQSGAFPTRLAEAKKY